MQTPGSLARVFDAPLVRVPPLHAEVSVTPTPRAHQMNRMRPKSGTGIFPLRYIAGK